MNCDLFETLVVPVLPDRPQRGGAAAGEVDLATWRARRHLASCADCAQRAARLEAALSALDMSADMAAAAHVRWPVVEPDPARLLDAEGPAAASVTRERWQMRTVLVLAVFGLVAVTVVWAQLEATGLAHVLVPRAPMDEGPSLATATLPIVLLLAGLAGILVGLVPIFVSRLFCQDGQCLA